VRFKYDCLNNRFYKIKGEYAYQTPEENQFIGQYGGQGFVLDSDQPNHWINFTVYEPIIRVFYKKVNKVNGEEEIIYYQKDIPRAEVIEFELTEEDIVAKRGGRWTKENFKK